MVRVLVRDILKYEGREVTLFGWVDVRRDHGKILFVDLRDRSGIVQLVFIPKEKALYKKGDALRSEWVVRVLGTVNKRPAGMENPNIISGLYEVLVKEIEVLNQAQTLPISAATDGYEIGEDARMKYRYLDLRRARLQKNLRVRHRVLQHIRDFLSAEDFVEVETPILSKSTPEGARDYLVPSRLHPGKFYALPQSPQQYKQLLMVAGLERYFQISRCFRDEDTRGDRQPEFTQLDIEMSFATQEDILDLTERLYISLVTRLFPEKKITTLDGNGKFPRLTYNQVMLQHQTDKPDLRKDRNDPDELAFAFITDFPMFEKKEDGSLGAVHHPFTLPTFDTSLDPNCLQQESSEEYQKIMKALESESESLKLLAYQYDFILNGYEIGGGSLRICNKYLLAKVFERLGNKPEVVEQQFGHMLEAFDYGVPPHGGIAPGVDRLVMVLQNEPNIREVIAFPKTGDGRDLMMDAPNAVDKEQLDELGLAMKKIK